MSKKHWPYLIAFGAVIIACLLGLLWQSRQPKNVAEIYLDGELVQRVEFEQLTEPVEIPVGEGNILCADREGIWMKHADCPDGLCIKQGKLSGGNLEIICLPNRVRVCLRAEGGWDGIAQ